MLVYIPTKNKSKIHGLWRDNGKLYFDKLTVKRVHAEAIEDLRRKYNQIAIFYSQGRHGYIKSAEGVTELKKRYILTLQKRPSKNLLYFMIETWRGVTVYRRKDKYIIVSYN